MDKLEKNSKENKLDVLNKYNCTYNIYIVDRGISALVYYKKL